MRGGDTMGFFLSSGITKSLDDDPDRLRKLSMGGGGGDQILGVLSQTGALVLSMGPARDQLDCD